MMISIVVFLMGLLLAIIIHEVGHTLSALLLGVEVEVFSIGFGKVIWKKKWRNIQWQVALIPLGGYTKLAGEDNKSPHGFLSQPYWKKVIILISGVLMNLLLACVIYLIHYENIWTGMRIDWNILTWIFTHQRDLIYTFVYVAQPNLLLLQISLINFGLALFNILPLPSLDGGMLWAVLLENKVADFETFLKKFSYYGFLFLLFLQFILIYWVYWG